MKYSFTIDQVWLKFVFDLLSDRSLDLKDIHEELKKMGANIPLGELRSILSSLYFLGILDRRKSHKNSYKYKIKN